MQLSVTGHHIEITAALRNYVEKKLGAHHASLRSGHRHSCRADRGEAAAASAEATLRVRGETIHALASDPNMYAAIDALADKLERRVRKHKEKLTRSPCRARRRRRAPPP